jgi:hypothetical protein
MTTTMTMTMKTTTTRADDAVDSRRGTIGHVESVLKARYDELCDCESLRDENAVVSHLLVDDLGLRTSVCLPFLERWLLFPRDRAKKLLELMATALEHGVDLRDGYAFMEREVEGDIDSDLVLLRNGGWNKLPEW